VIGALPSLLAVAVYLVPGFTLEDPVTVTIAGAFGESTVCETVAESTLA
jgi:hypothetical protein